MNNVVDQKKVEYVKDNLTIQEYFDNVILEDDSMREYYDGATSITVGYGFNRCPFHKENEGSFKVYLESNSYYCFGCHAGGDIIQLHRQHMLINMGIPESFDTSIDYLYQLASDLRNGAKKPVVVVGGGKQVKIINDKSDLVKFSVKLNRLIGYVMRVEKDIEVKADKMYAINVCRDSVYGQVVEAKEAIEELEKVIMSN